jgi:dephospho-CoA kinase
LNSNLVKNPSKKNLVVGFVGGIGSGKSAVADQLTNHFDTLLINADQVGHQVLTFPKIKQQIRAAFGDGVFVNDEISRKELANQVFKTPNSSKLQQLEEIVHPEIRRQIEFQIEQGVVTPSQDQPKTCERKSLVILDAPVMFEAGWNQVCDFVVFLETPIETRLARIANRGWDAGELQRRESSQWTLDEKRAAADAIVDNSGSLKDTVQQVKALITN